MKTLVTVLTLLLLSCSAAPERQYFGIAYTLVDVQAHKKALFDYSVRIVEPEIRLAYDRPQIVYRYDPFRFKYYNYKFWVAKPQQMVGEVLHRHFQHANLFRETSLVYQRQVPDYELVGEIEAIEEYDSGDKWYAHLAMTLRLVRFADRTIIWTYQFDRKQEVFNKEPVYVVRGMSDLMEEEMQEVLAGVQEAMAAEVVRQGANATP
jgi:ABC-type uncharacterized transport system auxiliary subunit